MKQTWKSRVLLLTILIVMAVVLLGGFRNTGVWLLKDDVPAHADAMVVLMGSIPGSRNVTAMKRTWKSRILLPAILFVVAMVLVGGCRKAGVWLVKDDEPTQADAIVMLVGNNSDRVPHVADLYEKGVSGKILMVKPSKEFYKAFEERGVPITSNAVKARNALIELGIPADSITIVPGKDEASTLLEAVSVRDYLASGLEINSVLLVSSSYHMRRASIIFERAFKQHENSVAVYCSPSPYNSFNASQWWKNRKDIQLVVLEYVKFGNFLLFDKKELRK